MSSRLSCSFVFLVLSGIWSPDANAQEIIDPCFSSISPIGYYNNSADIVNLCKCSDNFVATDLLRWDGSQWEGRLNSNINLPPPEGCNKRAIWMGYEYWTVNGEAFALRLTSPLEANKSYTFTFTYAKDGNSSADSDDQIKFSPIVYTDKSTPSLWNALRVGRLPGVNGWETHSITFTATANQQGHQWILLHAVEVSGLVISNCNIENPIKKNLNQRDTTICIGEPLTIQGDEGDNFIYHWSNGATSSSIVVSDPGLYTVEIQYGECNNADSITVHTEDCEVRLVMPNVFTPNDSDTLNSNFEPMEYNYIASGELVIYNRWGKAIFTGDIFMGWNGRTDNDQAASGVYYYAVHFLDRKKHPHLVKGSLMLVR